MGGVGRGGFWTGRLLRCDKDDGENAASSARTRRSRLKIATDVIGVIKLSVPRQPQVFWSQSMQRSLVLVGCSEIPTEIGVGPCPAESATGPIEKMPHRSDCQIWRRTAERPVGSRCLLCQTRAE